MATPTRRIAFALSLLLSAPLCSALPGAPADHSLLLHDKQLPSAQPLMHKLGISRLFASRTRRVEEAKLLALTFFAALPLLLISIPPPLPLRRSTTCEEEQAKETRWSLLSSSSLALLWEEASSLSRFIPSAFGMVVCWMYLVAQVKMRRMGGRAGIKGGGGGGGGGGRGGGGGGGGGGADVEQGLVVAELSLRAMRITRRSTVSIDAIASLAGGRQLANLLGVSWLVLQWASLTAQVSRGGGLIAKLLGLRSHAAGCLLLSLAFHVIVLGPDCSFRSGSVTEGVNNVLTMIFLLSLLAIIGMGAGQANFSRLLVSSFSPREAPAADAHHATDSHVPPGRPHSLQHAQRQARPHQDCGPRRLPPPPSRLPPMERRRHRARALQRRRSLHGPR
ncbi:hypothetical protein GUITHDRAFT_149622 [Guillardia theta CCMP2712]|uniref:Uncharacterized protein n=1 Tax=Guillardia theta (strain CCMP2712) TaxID=905079 RepID=L1I3U0_GUITC|nr:hypothetical protein GUITHDRAFT_149622 [Guillardia theta CCMP2712]EKX30886.1 hypothetical protein GUITHDRAFT_149622 [Guillardia theta CCMP2712]|eukprot:XP_005817866.1 hypothetical protein GUITHDRAFT_149622 [Guillardia theta CCMP2712]